ncbi:complement factor H isoform X1 [Anguilla anguilla]|uniref:complement factor H isoform X1 n=1 Tax=Anguilla anguilla TaxID=7936 RepID=UPI0015A8EB65|nr:complement factor H isoform X1 [Anguilla anguilla]
MQAVGYGCFLILWICFSAVAKAQNGCPGSSIPKNLNNEQPSDIKDIYASGDALRLSCQAGYAGFLRIICTNGDWEISGRRRCDPKQCGHPGDTPHGNFMLTRGEDFVFGSQVEYTCKKGYILAGKVNHRSCMDQGWDNAIPICEVVKCKPVQATGDLIASGNTESPQYGDIIQFECRTDEKKIDGEKQIHCTDTGEWSASIPQCEEITCKVPVIQNGWVTNQKAIYKKDDVLSFACAERYTPVGRPSTCTYHDWRPKPQCEENVCRVDPLSDIQPKTRAVFYPKESATIVCKESYRTQTKKQRDTVTCGDNGWSFSTFCEEISCSFTPEDNVAWLGYGHSVRHKSTAQYYTCKNGFRKSSRSTCEITGWEPPVCQAITCDPKIPNAIILSGIKKYTLGERLDYECELFHEPKGKQETFCRESGWEKKPDCKAIKGFCQRPVLENGYLIPDKSSSSVIHYGCIPGYKPSVDGWWGELTCTNSVWSDNPKCIGENECVPPTTPKNAILKERKDVYSNGEFLTYECDDGYKMESNDRIKCVNGSWESALPICKPSDTMCDPPPRVEYATITTKYKTKYAHPTKMEFQCTELYEIEGNREVTCRHGTWSAVPKCIRSKCSSPEDKVNNAVLVHKKEGPYENGAKVDYECEDTFIPGDETKAICINGQWKYPHCTKKDYCEKPDLPHGYVESPKKTYMEGEMLEYRCYSPCEPKTNNSITCKNGQWDGQVECICPQKTCQKPPVPENGDIVSTEVENGETVVTYQCKLQYKLKDERKVRCHEGEWKPFPVCIGPCVIETINPEYNLKDLKERTYVLEGKKIKMKCKDNYYINRWVDNFEVKCEDGEITGYRTCQYYTKLY